MLKVKRSMQPVILIMILYADHSVATPTKTDRMVEAAHESSALAPQSIETSILCAGDIMLVGSAKPVIAQRGIEYPFDRIRSIIEAADLAIGNLEMPLATSGDPFPDKEFVFVGQPKLAQGIAKAGFDVLALANNHIGDYGDEALLETLEVLSANNLLYCGAGPDLQTARQPAIVKSRNVYIAVLAYSKTYPFEFFAGEGDPGTVNGIAEIFVPDIKAARERANLVVVSFHWSGELVTEPREYQEWIGKKAIDAGADLVFGHHPHVLQGIEVYRGKIIAYSLGDFVFGSGSESKHTGAILRVTFRDGKTKRAAIDEIRTLSQKWGTEIIAEENRGIIKL
ncbi:MAG: CapA family protein [Candidatus Poribacteria bacterium]|nr:CapA family protein [Candidatus Poribacteria bacterium]MDE0502715.1 CapA family protein [Candidatus Poribacteria bacterium]